MQEECARLMGTRRELAEIGVRLLDDAYIAWVTAASDAERSLRAWLEAGCGAERETYSAYRAALDREEAAARDLQRLSEIAGPCRETLEHGVVVPIRS